MLVGSYLGLSNLIYLNSLLKLVGGLDLEGHMLMVILDLACSFVLVAFSTLVFLSVHLGDLVSELVGESDLEGPRVGGVSGLGGQLCLGSLQNWVLHVSLLDLVVLDGLIVGANLGGVVLGEVGPRGLDSFGFNLGNFVIDSSFTSSSCFDLTSMSA